ncbi:MAG: hypothetical protein U0324_13615 [Polyangiales bacterium]
MTLRTALAAATVAVASLASATAFAQSAPCNPGAVPVAQPVVGTAVYATPPAVTPVYAPAVATTVVAQPGYAPQPVYAQPGYAQPGYGRPVQHGFGQRRALMAYTSGLQARVAQAERQVRFGVSRGAVAPQALQAFAAQRMQLDGAVAQASQDGFLAPQEQAALEQMLAHLERVDERFRAPVAPVAYGNGYGRRWR